jgi:hypothetical protein
VVGKTSPAGTPIMDLKQLFNLIKINIMIQHKKGIHTRKKIKEK